MKLLQSITAIFAASILISCNGESKAKNKSKTKEYQEDKAEESATVDSKNGSVDETVMESNGIKIYPAAIEKTFPDAKLTLEKPMTAKEAGSYEFKFSVENYELMQPTEGMKMKQLANSQKGQHIHFILNNAPYQAKYESTFNADLMEGNNVVLAFLSRSYHESIKNKNAFILKNFKIGSQAGSFDKNMPHLFYSRPKGAYKGEDAKKLLLDFYLLNTELGENGNKVRVSIDKTDFMLTKWQPYFVEGLESGTHEFRIRLIDEYGNVIEGPFNDSGAREIVIE